MLAQGAAHPLLPATLVPRRQGEGRSAERLAAHYAVERRLADRMRAAATAEERREISATMYDELFREVPDHPRLLSRGGSAAERERDIDWDVAQLEPYLTDGCTFLEIGGGDCALARRVAKAASRVYAVEICDQTRAPLPANVELVISDGCAIPVPEASVDLAFSDQLLEHLHPEDAAVQLANVARALKPGGAYVCITPNRLYGPSDISGYFSDEARGFHLREYTLREIRAMFAAAGFPRMHAYVGARGWFMRCPLAALEAFEAILESLPSRIRRRIADTKPIRAILGVRVAAIKA